MILRKLIVTLGVAAAFLPTYAWGCVLLFITSAGFFCRVIKGEWRGDQ